MTAPEIIRLPIGIPGVGRAGDRIVSTPDDERPEYRLLRMGFLDPELLVEIKEKVREWENAAKRKEVTP